MEDYSLYIYTLMCKISWTYLYYNKYFLVLLLKLSFCDKQLHVTNAFQKIIASFLSTPISQHNDNLNYEQPLVPHFDHQIFFNYVLKSYNFSCSENCNIDTLLSTLYLGNLLNSCISTPNGKCKPTFNIYVSRAFQRCIQGPILTMFITHNFVLIFKGLEDFNFQSEKHFPRNVRTIIVWVYCFWCILR
jgi:hypothetical protein